MQFPYRFHKPFRVFLPLLFFLGIFSTGCTGEKWSYLEEYDDAYATSADEAQETENLIRLEEYRMAHPEEPAPEKKRFKMSPGLRNTLLYIGGGILELGLNVLIIYLTYF